MASAIVELWVRLVRGGEKTIEQVPKLLRSKVEAELTRQ